MNGPTNYREADLILTSDPCDYGCPHSGCPHEMAKIGRAIAHGLLALADATALSATMGPEEHDEWDRATGRLGDTEAVSSLPPPGPPIGASRHGPGCGCPYCPPADEVTR